MMHTRYLLLPLLSSVVALTVVRVVSAAEPADPASNRAESTSTATAASAKKTPVVGSQAELGMSVTGTQEAPKVLYIVPWKTLDAVPAEPYVSGLLDEVFSPVDPVVFERSVRHHEQIQGAVPAAEPQP